MTVELDELLSDKEIMPSLAAAPKLAIGKPTKSHHTAKKSVSPTEKKPAGGKGCLLLLPRGAGRPGNCWAR